MLRDNADNYSAKPRPNATLLYDFDLYKYQVRGLNTRSETIIPDRRYSAQDKKS